MENINSIGFALDPTNVPSFLLDWEVTKLCNLDCSYCGTSIETGGHNNDTEHPPLADCLRTIDFMYSYVDQYMKYKRPSQRKVILNIYGGESLFHPDIVEILQACRDKHEQYQDSWYLTIICTTNGVVGKTRWKQIVPLIDEFTVSYHTENLPKQKQQYQDNVLYLKQLGKRFRCVVMMHNDPKLWEDSLSMIEFCKTHEMRFTPKPFDNALPEMLYTADQFSTLKTFWLNRTPSTQKLEYIKKLEEIGTNTEKVQSIDQGRPCCGGRKLSLNGDLKSNVTFVPRQGFEGWSCSVNWFFLYIQQLTGKIYTNRDCRMSTTNKVEELGTLDQAEAIISILTQQLETKTMPIIKCAKQRCLCGFCAPKAETVEDFRELIFRNVTEDVFTKKSVDNSN
jgi:hypothetical protein